MKKLYTIILFAFTGTIAHSQNVNIPDANFKAALVSNPSINTNADGEIQITEASAYTGAINVSAMNISDLTGIEAFTTLTTLYCYTNQLTGLNVSANTALTKLHCYNNQLTGLDVSVNTALTDLACSFNQLTSLNLSSNTALTLLSCGFNQLTTLDVSSNTALSEFHCGNNQLTSLNLSANTALIWLNCSNNQLTSLNVKNGNNTNFTGFNATNNPNLTCIQVDDAAYSNANWASGKDATASYDPICTFTGIANLSNNAEITFYPNPFSSYLTLHSDKTFNNATLTVYNTQGCQVKQIKNISEQTITLHRDNLPSGLYFIRLTQDNKIIAADKFVITE